MTLVACSAPKAPEKEVVKLPVKDTIRFGNYYPISLTEKLGEFELLKLSDSTKADSLIEGLGFPTYLCNKNFPGVFFTPTVVSKDPRIDTILYFSRDVTIMIKQLKPKQLKTPVRFYVVQDTAYQYYVALPFVFIERSWTDSAHTRYVEKEIFPDTLGSFSLYMKYYDDPYENFNPDDSTSVTRLKTENIEFK